MKVAWLCWLCGGLALNSVSFSSAQEEAAAVPAGPDLLQAVINHFPQEPLKIAAQLQSRNRNGAREKNLNTELFLDWHAAPPTARYTVKDAFGASLEALAIIRPAEGDTQYLYYKGDPLKGGALPNLYAPIQETDVSWIDLSLAFLWWPFSQVVGEESVKGRQCLIVEATAPFRNTNTYSIVRMWIDPQVYVLLQAAALDDKGQELKRLQVKSFKKINDVWMIRDLEIQDVATHHKTLFRVRRVDTPDRFMLPDDEGGPDEETPVGEGVPAAKPVATP